MGKSYTSKGGREPFEFELDGVSFVCTGELDVIDLAELAKLAKADIDSPEGMAAIADSYKATLGAEGYVRFRRHTREHHTDNDTLFEILNDMVEHNTAGPTKRSSPSARGPQNMNGMSVDVSPLPAQKLTDEQVAKIRAALAGR